ncbi:hypothetical protein [Streptomyces coffeae]|uniref:DUF2127 domain-containing protein n=1 Tax=Streptomyces coffeae TaxID=621382 RepID=A0ABS1NBJ7_9ACTN|nr:hypothetical protein [Streptomyces coffeae]MBL1097289.1 hypothetical protein [Streptomyces coffeae]
MSSRSPGAHHGERPQQVETAYVLSLAAIALQGVSWALDAFVIAPTGLDEMRHHMGQREAVLQLILSGGVVCVIGALWLLLAVKMRAGYNWARIVLAAAGALSALFVLNSLSMSGYPWEEMITIGPDLLGLGAIALIFLPPSNAYFSGRTVSP